MSDLHGIKLALTRTGEIEHDTSRSLFANGLLFINVTADHPGMSSAQAGTGQTPF